MQRKIAVVVGSLRENSFNLNVAKTLISLAPKSLNLELVEIRDLPLYNQDLDREKDTPAAWTKFRNQINQCDGVLFVTPEYNRSIPAPLKNAIDVGSRPAGKSAWNNKPAAIVSASPGAIGGFGAHQHLRQAIACLNMPLLPKPETYISNVATLFNEQGELIKEDTYNFFRSFMEAFSQWVEVTAPRN